MDARPVLGVPTLRPPLLVDVSDRSREAQTSHRAHIVTNKPRKPHTPFTIPFVLDDDPDDDLDDDEFGDDDDDFSDDYEEEEYDEDEDELEELDEGEGGEEE